jgi:hypothetical protein
MRRACFSIILYMTGSAIDVAGPSPLAPLATDSLFASESRLFDMAKDNYVFRLMEPDGTAYLLLLTRNSRLSL